MLLSANTSMLVCKYAVTNPFGIIFFNVLKDNVDLFQMYVKECNLFDIC